MSFPLHVQGRAHDLTAPIIGRITTTPKDPGLREDYVFLNPAVASDLGGYAALLLTRDRTLEEIDDLSETPPFVRDLPYSDHLTDGDIVHLSPSGFARTLFKASSQSNAIFATDMCNSFCLMCSQPPKKVNDRERIKEHLRLVSLIDPSTPCLSITGGEPTLLGRDLVRLIAHCKEQLPFTALQVLSNGRLFKYQRFANDLGSVSHPNLMFAVPIYSDLDYEHDFVVQALGAFDETIKGVHNLAASAVRVEIRVVIHALTYRRLRALAEFLYWNLPFADHVALMGLEPVGFAVPNLKELWVDPFDYRDELAAAVSYLAARGMNVSIYNHQLCIVPKELWPYCRASISDWKNDYIQECEACNVRATCGGFFSSSLLTCRSSHVHAVRASSSVLTSRPE